MLWVTDDGASPAPADTQGAWSARYTAVVGRQVALYRRRLRWSAQRLADECVSRGHPLTRSNIANLENGRRPSVGLPEVLVMAEALGVTPAALMLPLAGNETEVEVQPGSYLDPVFAWWWLTGGGGSGRPPEMPLLIRHYEAANASSAALRSLTRSLETMRAGPLEDTAHLELFVERDEMLVERFLTELAQIREAMLKLGMSLPALAPEIESELARLPLRGRTQDYSEAEMTPGEGS